MAADLESYLALKQEIEQIGRDMRSGSVASQTIGQRIAKALDQFESLLKSEAYLAMAKDTGPEVVEPEIPSEVLAKRTGIPGSCADCGQDQCACFAHLPKPRITIRPDRMIKIAFPVEYTATDKVAWLQAMKLAISKRKGK